MEPFLQSIATTIWRNEPLGLEKEQEYPSRLHARSGKICRKESMRGQTKERKRSGGISAFESMVEPRLFVDEATLETQLEREYRIRSFFDWGPFFSNSCLIGIVLNLFLFFNMPGGRDRALGGGILFMSLYVMRKHVDAQRGTEYEEYGMDLLGKSYSMMLLVQNGMNHNDGTLSSDEARNANVSMIVLAIYFFLSLLFRVSGAPFIYRLFGIVFMPLYAFKFPRFGILTPHYESLAFFLTLAFSELVGSSIEKNQKKSFVLLFRVLLKEIRTRAEMAHREQEAKETAARHADSLLNHTLKNIMADGIASVELFEQSQDEKFLEQAKCSMKHGMTWTRRRQSLLMVCQGTYRPQPQAVNLRELLLECINGRQIETGEDEYDCDWCPLNVRTDPILLSLAFENGLSNAIKHNRPGSVNPRVHARVVSWHDLDNTRHRTHKHTKNLSSILEITIRNHATPGAAFISKEVEKRLFQEGMHGKLSTISSDGIGLGHAKMMTELLGGTVSLRQAGELITYTIRVPTESLTKENPQSGSPPASSLISSPESSPETSREIALADKARPAPAFPRAGGGSKPLAQCFSFLAPKSQRPVRKEVQSASAPSPSPAKSKPKPKLKRKKTVQPTRGMFIDDSRIARKYAGAILFPKILGIKESIILGENRAQLDLCVSFATAMHPDIIIIDENLELLDEKSPTKATTVITGTQICRDLVAAGVGALLCIRSGNTSPEDVSKYIAAGAHGVICKSFDNNSIAEPLLEGFRRLRDKDPNTRKTGFPILLLD